MRQHPHATVPSAPHHAPRRRRSPFLRFLLICFLLVTVPIVALGATAVTATAVGGLITVEVDEHQPNGTSIWLPIPAFLVDLATLGAPLVIPPEAHREIEQVLGENQDNMREIIEGLVDGPDGVWVNARGSDGEVVTIEKRRGALTITVDSPDADVRVAMPARLVRRAAGAVGLI
ncbi:MAG: hypothetical protein AAF772_04675 [Acidobacteriota bacterium]